MGFVEQPAYLIDLKIKILSPKPFTLQHAKIQTILYKNTLYINRPIPGAVNS